MLLGALLDAGADGERVQAELAKLLPSGWSLSVARVKRGPLVATQVTAHVRETHPHRGLKEILDLIARAELTPRAAVRASEIFQRLAEAEARVHGVPVEKVHFHEVGAVDSILDIAGACVAFELLGIEQFACSALNLGGGRVQTAHGVLPVPAPATAAPVGVTSSLSIPDE
ncbi:LarC family nickel insertion protein [Acidobacteriia bacterium AH_259_A11_L15]|nr:LarC family nickel insertion protein [Acidobacteriia bacterium AH_259_A11_L15]